MEGFRVAMDGRLTVLRFKDKILESKTPGSLERVIIAAPLDSEAADGDGSIHSNSCRVATRWGTGMPRLPPPCRSPRLRPRSVERRYLTVGGCGAQWPPTFSNITTWVK
jgi:hypothetical protein